MSITTKSGLQVGSAGKQRVVDDEKAHMELSTGARPFWLRHPLLALFCVALAARGVVAILLTRYFSGSFVLDDQTYWDIARDLVLGLTSQWDAYQSGLYAQTRAFSLPLAGAYGVSGGNELAGQLLVASLGAGLSVVVYVIARKMLGPRLAFFPALVIVLLPSQVLWSSLILKDAFVWFGLATLALIFIRHARAADRSALMMWSMGLAVSLLFLAFLRPHSTVVAAWALLLVCWVGNRHQLPLRIASVVMVAVAVPWLSGLGPAGVTFAMDATPVSEIREANAAGAESAIVPTPELDPEVKKHAEAAAALQAERAELERQIRRTTAGSKRERFADRLLQVTAHLAVEQTALQEATEQISQDPARDVGVRYIVRGISVMIAEPYPWNESTSPSFTMAKLETIVWYPILILAVIGLLPGLRSHRDVILLPLVLGSGIMLLYALTEGNVGSAFRHRGEFIWVVALLAGLGVASLIEKRSRAA